MSEDSIIFPSEKVNMVADLIKEVHKGQFRKDGKTPFYTHPFAVAKLVQEYVSDDDDILIVALSHDTVEDIDDFDIDEFLTAIYGDNDSVIDRKKKVKDMVLALTKNDTLPTRHERDLDSYERIFNVRNGAPEIKLCDRYHNVTDMDGMKDPFKLRYIAETHFLLGYFIDYKDKPIYKNLLKITEIRMKDLLERRK